MIREREGDGTGSGSCPTAGFPFNDVEPSASTFIVLINILGTPTHTVYLSGGLGIREWSSHFGNS